MAPSMNSPWQGAHASCRDLAQLGRAAWRALRTRLRPARRHAGHQDSSLAVFDVSELTELRDIFGDGAACHTEAVIRRALRRIDPLMGRILRPTATSFAVMLPGYDAEGALAAVHGALGETPSIDSDWHGEELMVVPDFRVRSLSDPRESVGQVYEQMLGEIIDGQQCARRRRDYLRQERESHLPAAKAAASTDSDIAPAFPVSPA